jgi:sigma-B regulation protein RsbU (phosphoserine phosphatase)
VDEHTIRLSPGDFLMIYTDGIGEAQDEAGELFERSALKEHIVRLADKTGADLSRRLIAACKEFGHPSHQWDDITIFGIDMT